MATKAAWKLKTKQLKKKVKRLRKILKVGMKTLKEREAKIAQLSSVLEQQQQTTVAITQQRAA